MEKLTDLVAGNFSMPLIWIRGLRKLQVLGIGLLLGGAASAGEIATAALPKGNCADPKPYTDLRHCRFEGQDLRNKDLTGTDLRGMSLYKTQFQGANLTNSIFGGNAIVHASLDGAIGLPTEALAILKSVFLVTHRHSKFKLSRLPDGYVGSNEQVAGLDNIFLVRAIPGQSNHIALLSYPRFGASSTTIFAQFKKGKFDLPSCYQSVELMNDDNSYYFAHWDSMKVRSTSNGGYLIGVIAFGNDGDELGQSEWRKVAILGMTPTCELTVLYEEYLERAGDTILVNGKQIEEWCGGELDFRFIDDKTVEVKTTIPVSSKRICGDKASSREHVKYKQIKLGSKHKR